MSRILDVDYNDLISLGSSKFDGEVLIGREIFRPYYAEDGRIGRNEFFVSSIKLKYRFDEFQKFDEPQLLKAAFDTCRYEVSVEGKYKFRADVFYVTEIVHLEGD